MQRRDLGRWHESTPPKIGTYLYTEGVTRGLDLHILDANEVAVSTKFGFVDLTSAIITPVTEIGIGDCVASFPNGELLFVSEARYYSAVNDAIHAESAIQRTRRIENWLLLRSGIWALSHSSETDETFVKFSFGQTGESRAVIGCSPIRRA